MLTYSIDIVASNLPKLEKTSGWSRKVVKRDLRLVFTVDDIKQELPWKAQEEQLKWLKKEYAFPCVLTILLCILAHCIPGLHALRLCFISKFEQSIVTEKANVPFYNPRQLP